MQLLHLSRAEVEAAGVTMDEVLAALEAMFLEKGAGRVEMPPKPGVHPQPDAFIHAMPAHVPALGATGVKWVSGFPGNVARGLPYISGLLILNDPETGLPTCVMDATWITAVRTGAATAIAARRLARRDSRTLGVVACGVQGRSNLAALSRVFSLERVRAFDLRREAAEAFAREVGERHGLAVEVVDTPRAAVEGLDLVVTSGPILKQPRPVVEPDWISPGTFLCALDFDSYVTGAAFRAVDRLTTDDLGQMEHYRELGFFSDTPRADCDLGQLVCGTAPGRAREDERIVAVQLGLALEDMPVAVLVLARARARGLGTRLAL
ncbi:MAG TPA: ornithine cyclodeaminase family protein [Planctomycetota bacterium]|nr:ornithine cyclodeaminase family protein [Planctomycetota bacterium]